MLTALKKDHFGILIKTLMEASFSGRNSMSFRFLWLANSADFYFLKPKKWEKGLIVFMMSKMGISEKTNFKFIFYFQVCRFNSFHHIPRGRMEEHIKKCQGSVTVLKEKPFVPKVGTTDDGISNIMTGTLLAILD